MPWKLIPRTRFLVGNRLAWGPTHVSRFHTGQQAYAIERSHFQPKRTDNQMRGGGDYSQGKLYARPGQASVDQSPPLLGLQPLGTGARRDGLIYTPKSYQHGRPSPLCVIMHGAGGNAKGALFAPLEDIAEKVMLLLQCMLSVSILWASAVLCVTDKCIAVVLTIMHMSGIQVDCPTGTHSAAHLCQHQPSKPSLLVFADRNDFSFTTVAVQLLGCHSRGLWARCPGHGQGSAQCV